MAAALTPSEQTVLNRLLTKIILSKSQLAGNRQKGDIAMTRTCHSISRDCDRRRTADRLREPAVSRRR